MKKNRKTYCSIEGEWSQYIKFNDEVYWNNFIYPLPKFYLQNKMLKSDSIYREDLNCLINNKIDESQKFKEEYEEIQRKDRDLRLKLKFTNKK